MSSCKEQLWAHVTQIASRDCLGGDLRPLWIYSHTCAFLKQREILGDKVSVYRKGLFLVWSYKMLLLAKANNPHPIFSVFFVSFSLSEMPEASMDLWCSIAQVKGLSPAGLTGLNFLHEEHIQQNREDCSYTHADLPSSERPSIPNEITMFVLSVGRK